MGPIVNEIIEFYQVFLYFTNIKSLLMFALENIRN